MKWEYCAQEGLVEWSELATQKTRWLHEVDQFARWVAKGLRFLEQALAFESRRGSTGAVYRVDQPDRASLVTLSLVPL